MLLTHIDIPSTHVLHVVLNAQVLYIMQYVWSYFTDRLMCLYERERSGSPCIHVAVFPVLPHSLPLDPINEEPSCWYNTLTREKKRKKVRTHIYHKCMDSKALLNSPHGVSLCIAIIY